MLREEAHDVQEEYVAEATARQRESFASETLCSGNLILVKKSSDQTEYGNKLMTESSTYGRSRTESCRWWDCSG